MCLKARLVDQRVKMEPVDGPYGIDQLRTDGAT